jgi:hypothetical protein
MTESAPRRAISFRAGLAGITIGALLLRVTYVLMQRRDFPLKGDDFFYHWQGRALADGLGFINPFSWRALDRLDPTAAHPPLYSLFVGGVSKLGLTSPLSHRLASCLLGAAAVAVIGLVAHRIAGARAGWLAAGLAAVYPNLWINDGMLTSETLYALLIALVLLVSYQWIEEPGGWRLVLLGALVGLASLTRPEAILLVPFMSLAILFSRRAGAPANAPPPGESSDTTSARGPGWSRRLLAVAVLAGSCVVVIAPWLVRNAVTFENPVLLASGHGSVLEVSNCDSTYSGDLLGYWDPRCVTNKRPPANERERRLREQSTVPGLVYLLAQDDRDESVADERARKAGLDYIGDHLSRVPLVALARVGRVWEVYRPLQGIDLDTFFERRGLWPSRIGLAMFYLLAGLSLWELITRWRARRAVWPFLSIIAVTTLTAAISIGITRYRVGSDVVLVVLAGLALDQVWRRVRARRAEVEAAPSA